MVSVFVLGEPERVAIRAAIERASKKVIPWEVLRQHIPAEQETGTLRIEDRRGGPVPREPEQVILPFGYRLAISFEEQPAGVCLHLSMSFGFSLPDPLAVALVIKATGHDDAPRRVWVEEYLIDGKPGGRAINVVLVVEPAEA